MQSDQMGATRTTLAEVLKRAAWPKIEACLRQHYCQIEQDADSQDEFVLAHEYVYGTIRKLRPEPDGMVIAIDPEEENGVHDFHVHGINPGADDSWGLTFARWERSLGTEVAPSTLWRFSPSEIVAHCLHEMSFVGYDHETIQRFREEIEHRAEEAMNDCDESGTIDADDVFREEYGNDPEWLAEFYRQRDAHFRQWNRDRSAGRGSDAGDDHD